MSDVSAKNLEDLNIHTTQASPLSEICNMEALELLAMQSALGMGDEWGIWQVPADRMPSGVLQTYYGRTIRIELLTLHDEYSAPNVQRAWIELIRYAIVRTTHVGIRRIVKPSTVCTELRKLIKICREIISRPIPEGQFWATATEEDLIRAATPEHIYTTLASFHHRGLLPDKLPVLPRVTEVGPERDRFNEPEVPERIEENTKWQPFPDDFTSAAGWRALYIVNELAPSIIDAIEEALKIPIALKQNGEKYGKAYETILTRSHRNEVISKWNWSTHNLFPFYNKQRDLSSLKDATNATAVFGAETFDLQWPPNSFESAWKFLNLIQGASLFLTALATGARASELSSLTSDCLIVGEEDRTNLKFKTYKNDATGGRDRVFPIPHSTANSLRIQIRLAKLIKNHFSVEGQHIWVHLHILPGSENRHLSSFMNNFIEKIGIKNLLLPEAPRPHLHRFRKTLARIVALAAVNSPMILMDCFGHDDPDITLRHYILSNPDIAREVLTIQKELVILMCIDVVTEVEGLSGAAGEQLTKRKIDFLKLLGKSEFEPQDAYEFARRETCNGRSWMIVAPGVYCTLPENEGGLCSKSQGGGANPAYCQAGCPFQLLKNSKITDADECISEILVHLQRSIDDEAPMLIAQWAGQLTNWLDRWPSVYCKFKSHPLIIKFYEPGMHHEI